MMLIVEMAELVQGARLRFWSERAWAQVRIDPAHSGLLFPLAGVLWSAHSFFIFFFIFNRTVFNRKQIIMSNVEMAELV